MRLIFHFDWLTRAEIRTVTHACTGSGKESRQCLVTSDNGRYSRKWKCVASRLVLSTTKLISHNSFRTSVTIIQTIYSRKINQMDEKAESVWDWNWNWNWNRTWTRLCFYMSTLIYEGREREKKRSHFSCALHRLNNIVFFFARCSTLVSTETWVFISSSFFVVAIWMIANAIKRH